MGEQKLIDAMLTLQTAIETLTTEIHSYYDEVVDIKKGMSELKFAIDNLTKGLSKES